MTVELSEKIKEVMKIADNPKGRKRKAEAAKALQSLNLNEQALFLCAISERNDRRMDLSACEADNREIDGFLFIVVAVLLFIFVLSIVYLVDILGRL